MSIQEYDKTWLVVTKPNASAPASDVPQIAVEDADAASTGPTDASDGQPSAEQDTGTLSVVADDVNEQEGPDGPQGTEDIQDEVFEDDTIVKIMDITQMETKTGQSVVTKTRRFKKPKNKKDRFRDYAGILRRSLDEMGNLISVKLEIKSPFLKGVLRDVLKAHRRVNLDADTIILPMPYEALFHNRDALKEYRQTLTQDNELEQLDLLLEFMDTNLEEVTQEYERNVPHGKITAGIAWTLFPPGEIIVMNADSNTPAQCFVTKDCQRLMNGMLNVSCSCFEWNGSSFGKVSKTIAFQLPMSSGSFPITSLAAFPLRLHPQYEKLKARLIERGHRYTKIVKRAHMSYK